MSELKLEGALSSILENDDLMNKISGILSSHDGDANASLPDVIDLLSSTMGVGKGDDTADSPLEDATIEADEASSKGSSGLEVLLSSVSRSSALLCALKPYLSEKRSQMIDSILKIEKITQIMKLVR